MVKFVQLDLGAVIVVTVW